MAKVCVLLAEGFEEIEAITIIDVLRRAEVETVTLGVTGDAVTGAHGVEVRADRRLEDATDESWDMVILPGGIPGATNLRDHPRVRELLTRQCEGGGKVAAICAAPIALGAAGVLEGRRATSYPGFEGELRGATLSEDRVVRDGAITTSRGPGTALEFSFELVRQLTDDATADRLEEGMLVRTS